MFLDRVQLLASTLRGQRKVPTGYIRRLADDEKVTAMSITALGSKMAL